MADFEVWIFLFYLMSNHFPLLIETPKGNLSRLMQTLNTANTVYLKYRYECHGHLLDGRFKAKLVAEDENLLKLGRYIHLNSVLLPLGFDRMRGAVIRGVVEPAGHMSLLRGGPLCL